MAVVSLPEHRVSSLDMLNVAGAAELTGLSEWTLRSWRYRDRGEGPRSFKVGNRVRYHRADVLAWVAAQEAASSTRGGAA